MSRKIGIIGTGNVGATTAAFLTLHNIVEEIVLVDIKLKKATAEAIEIKQMLPNASAHVKVTATDDVALLADADIIINSVGAGMKEDRLDELKETSQIVKDVYKKVKETGFDGIIVSITNPCDVITMMVQEITGLPKERVFGTGTGLDTARLYAYIAEKLNVDPKSINGYVLGEHGESQFVAWSTVHIATNPIANFLKELPEGADFDYEGAKESVRLSGWQVVQGKGCTSYAIAQTAVRIIDCLLNDKQTILPLSVYVDALESYVSIPAMITKNGIRYIPMLNLTEEEKAKLQNSADIIKKAFQSVR